MNIFQGIIISCKHERFIKISRKTIKVKLSDLKKYEQILGTKIIFFETVFINTLYFNNLTIYLYKKFWNNNFRKLSLIEYIYAFNYN